MSPNGGKNILGSNKSDSASLKSDEIMKSSSSTSTIYEHEHESAKTNQASINNIQFDTVCIFPFNFILALEFYVTF